MDSLCGIDLNAIPLVNHKIHTAVEDPDNGFYQIKVRLDRIPYSYFKNATGSAIDTFIV